jgi:hypothetical protein
LLDEHAHELWLDLRESKGFDLVAWLGGREYGTPRLVLALIQDLPEGARYTALMSAPEHREGLPEPEYDPAAESLHDRRFWTPDRRLNAQMINALHQLILVSGKWKKNHEPEFPIVGPLEWHPPEQLKKEQAARGVQEPVTVLAAMKAMGFTGQIQI